MTVRDESANTPIRLMFDSDALIKLANNMLGNGLTELRASKEVDDQHNQQDDDECSDTDVHGRPFHPRG